MVKLEQNPDYSSRPHNVVIWRSRLNLNQPTGWMASWQTSWAVWWTNLVLRMLTDRLPCWFTERNAAFKDRSEIYWQRSLKTIDLTLNIYHTMRWSRYLYFLLNCCCVVEEMLLKLLMRRLIKEKRDWSLNRPLLFTNQIWEVVSVKNYR